MSYHIKDCIILVRPEMLKLGPCWGTCSCKCHEDYQERLEWRNWAMTPRISAEAYPIIYVDGSEQAK